MSGINSLLLLLQIVYSVMFLYSPAIFVLMCYLSLGFNVKCFSTTHNDMDNTSTSDYASACVKSNDLLG